MSKEENLRLNEEQQKLAVEFQSAAGALMNEYVKGDERSFTIIAFPVPEIGRTLKPFLTEYSVSIRWIISFIRESSRR